jgi:hypothetical protein
MFLVTHFAICMTPPRSDPTEVLIVAYGINGEEESVHATHTYAAQSYLPMLQLLRFIFCREVSHSVLAVDMTEQISLSVEHEPLLSVHLEQVDWSES